MIDEGQIEPACVFHRSPHHSRIRYGPPVIRNSHDSRILHLTHFGELFATAAFCNSADWKDVCEFRSLTLFNDEPRDGRIVVHRIRIWHRTDAGPTTGNCG